jgi:hypothetical protein
MKTYPGTFKAQCVDIYDCIKLTKKNIDVVLSILSDSGYKPRLIRADSGAGDPLYIKLGNSKDASKQFFEEYLMFDEQGVWEIVPEKEFKIGWKKIK